MLLSFIIRKTRKTRQNSFSTASEDFRPDRLLPQGVRPRVLGDRGAAAAGDVLRLPALAGRREGPTPARRGPAVCPALLNRPEQSVGPAHALAGQDKRRSAPRQHRPDLPGTARPACVWPSGSTRPRRPGADAEAGGPRHLTALEHPEQIERFGGLSLGESTHLVDEVARLPEGSPQAARAFLVNDRGRLSLPVWVDHVGSAGTRYVTGDLVDLDTPTPPLNRMPRIGPD